MRAEEIEQRAVRGRLRNGGAQGIGREPGQIEKAFRARGVGQDPGQRPERRAGGIVNRIFGTVKNCQLSVKQIWDGSGFPGAEVSGAQ